MRVDDTPSASLTGPGSGLTLNCLCCNSTVVVPASSRGARRPLPVGYAQRSRPPEGRVNENEQEPRESVEAGLAAEAAEEQGLLFTDDVSPLPSDTGYRGPTACNPPGIPSRQLDYWARTGLVEPTVRGAKGSGSQRLYSFQDILLLKVVKRLLDAGISLQQIRTAVQHLRERGTDDLTRVTLMSDGVSVYECTSTPEVIDPRQGGEGAFGIAIGGVWREIEGSLSELPSEKADSEDDSDDELAARRRARLTG